MLSAYSHARSPAPSLGRLFPPSLPDPSLVPACSKSVVISEYLSYTHCLALIYNPATRQTDTVLLFEIELCDRAWKEGSK